MARPHGLRGALRIALDNPASTALDTVKRVFLENEAAPREFRIKSAIRMGRSALRIELDGLDNCDAAENLRDATVMVATADL
ncbi:MAG TPA: hypothetical protein VNU00_09870, partial [Candidatus Binataceae bacterium]|nr:hypothetical protein [Candidatus Binataceae bacterium]